MWKDFKRLLITLTAPAWVPALIIVCIFILRPGDEVSYEF